MKLVCIITFGVLWLIALFNFNERVLYSMPEIFLSPAMRSPAMHNVSAAAGQTFCRLQWKSLHIQSVNIFHSPDIGAVEADNPLVEKGGRWRPVRCLPFQKVAIIIPYRDRWFHLRILLSRLHPMLRKQSIDYHIFVIEQRAGTPFNRGMLMNVGINEALKRANFDCFVFHDVDLIPEHDRNIYLCDDNTRHLSSAIDEMRYHVLFDNYAGGVVALTRDNIFKINGYSNSYWGWGNEDDDFSARTLSSGLKLSRPPEHIGRYKMVRHKKAGRADGGYALFMTWRSRQYKDGLNSLSPAAYHVTRLHEAKLYTNITVDLIQSQKAWDVGAKKGESFYWFLRFYGWLL